MGSRRFEFDVVYGYPFTAEWVASESFCTYCIFTEDGETLWKTGQTHISFIYNTIARTILEGEGIIP